MNLDQKRVRKMLLALAVVSSVLSVGAVYALVFSGTYTQPVNNPAPTPAFRITAVSDSLSDVCSFTAVTASCSPATLSVDGASYSITVRVNNTGLAAGVVTASASTSSGGLVDSITPGTRSLNITAGGYANFTFTITRVSAGSDNISINLSG